MFGRKITNTQECLSRVKRIKAEMNKQDLDAMLIYSPSRRLWHGLRATGNVAYVSNWSNAVDCIVVLPLEEEPSLLVSEGGGAAVESKAKASTWIEDVRMVAAVGHGAGNRTQSWEETASALREHKLGNAVIGTAGFEEMPGSKYSMMMSALKDAKLRDASQMLYELRSVKSERELELIKQGAALSDRIFELFPRVVKKGMRGFEIQGALEGEALKHGSDYASFWMASASNRARYNIVFDWGPHDRILNKGDQVQLGTNLVFNSYWAHQIRCGTIGGSSGQQRKLCQVALEAQNTIIDMLRPGLDVSDAVRAAYRVFEKAGHKAGGRLGHGLGLDYDEIPAFIPKTKTLIKEGMVLEVHPVMLAHGRAFYGAVGDMVHVAKRGVKFLTKHPREPMLLG